MRQDEQVQEGEGTLLDNSIVLYASGMPGGNHHADDLPVALIGKGVQSFGVKQGQASPLLSEILA